MDVQPQNFVKETISVQGLIGAGKSTLVKILRTKTDKLEKIFGYPVFFVNEPVDEWNKPEYDGKSALEVFYSDKERYKFTFQILAFTTRLDAIQKETSKLKQLSTCISDRSMLSDKEIFLEYFIDDIDKLELNTYNRLYDFSCANFNKTEKRIIYVESTPEECMVRIQKRNAGGDTGIPLEYLQAHDLLHKRMIDKFEKNGGIVYRIKPPYFEDNTLLEKYIDDFLETIK